MEKIVVSLPFVNTPIMFLSLVNLTSGSKGSGSIRLRATWL